MAKLKNGGVFILGHRVVGRLLSRFSIIGVVLTLVLLLAACGGEGTSSSPTAVPTSTVAVAATQIPEGTPIPSPTAGLPPDLELISPEDGAGVEVDAVRVMGKTSVDAAVGINGATGVTGVTVNVSPDGSFYYDIDLNDGANLIEVAATSPSGETAFQEVSVFYVSTTAGLPFTLFYPPDGLVVSEPEIPVFGGTKPDAVVGVNEIPVDINSRGIFSTSVTLEEGGNFIEVLATDIEGNVRFQTVAVFYLP
ncbi:MAG: hypothetical protein HQ475_13250 [SAR202 cluster bacterium]|nr:hypothetical protein [SAR202 cluster bacterium]